jgi:flagellum-specific ATP synthase
VSDALLGRVLDGAGRPIDGKGDISTRRLPPDPASLFHIADPDAELRVPDTLPERIEYRAVIASPPNPLERKSVGGERIVTGIRAIDALLAVAKGQRLGIFAGSGVGKSTLLSMIARNTTADVNVVALVGERGREVLDFVQRDLGAAGLKRSVVVAATADQPPIARMRSAFVAHTIAEYFRDQGKDVMLMFDTITRFAHAQREIGLASGEPPAQRGYPPSVFDLMPKLFERAGTSDKGTITAFYTVLVDGNDMDEPISDLARGRLDGHILLSRRFASSGHYPAIDVRGSISRVAGRVMSPEIKEAAKIVRRWISDYEENEDMITAGAYQKGSSAAVDKAIDMHPRIVDFLTQDEYEVVTLEDTLKRLVAMAGIQRSEELEKEYEKVRIFHG